VRRSTVRGDPDVRSEEAPVNRKVIALVEDPFWKTKIDTAVRSVGATTVFVSDPATAASVIDPSAPVIVVVDLALKATPFEAVSRLKKDGATAAIPVIGYFDIARKDLKEKAIAAGFDEVLARSSFAERFADLVLKYLLPGGVRIEEEEHELPEE
jgi:CheY-like chemotaxis protein